MFSMQQENHFLTELGAEFWQTKLAPFISEQRKSNISALLTRRIAHISVIAEMPSYPHNVAAIMRSAETFGLSQFHVVRQEGRAARNQYGPALGAEQWLHVKRYTATEACFNELHSQGIKIFAATMTGSLRVSQIPVANPFCLLFGNEDRGISEYARSHCDGLFHIPMFGMTESLNVSVAAAISLYEVTSRYRQNLKTEGDLSLPAQAGLLARFYLRSVDKRLVLALAKAENISTLPS